MFNATQNFDPSLGTEYTHECLGCGTFYRQTVEFCWNCARGGLVVPRSWRPIAPQVPTAPGVSARQLAAQCFEVATLKPYESIRMGPQAFVFLHGGPGSGKSTMALRIADCFAPALFLPLEERFSPVLIDRLRRLEIHSEAIRFELPKTIGAVFELVREQQPQVVVIDSVQRATLTPDDVQAIAQGLNTRVVAIGQHTKDGLAAGPNTWAHIADVVVLVDQMRWSLQKSRYQPLGVSGDVR